MPYAISIAIGTLESIDCLLDKNTNNNQPGQTDRTGDLDSAGKSAKEWHCKNNPVNKKAMHRLSPAPQPHLNFLSISFAPIVNNSTIEQPKAIANNNKQQDQQT